LSKFSVQIDFDVLSCDVSPKRKPEVDFRRFGQGRPVNAKHDARCVMGKVGGRQTTQRGEILIYCYIVIFIVIKYYITTL